VPLVDGGTVRLPQLIGLSRAMDLILTGRPISGKEAYEMGLANRVTATGNSLSQAVDLAQSIMEFPQECMNRDRESAYYAAYSAQSFEDAVRNELEKGITVISKVCQYLYDLTKWVTVYNFRFSFLFRTGVCPRRN